MSREGIVFPAVFTGISLVILVALGAWQMHRRAEKLGLIAAIDTRSKAAPASAPVVADWASFDPAVDAYRAVRARGTFRHDSEAHVFFSIPQPKSGIGGPGYLILTPFLLETGGIALVNRGFVPADRKDAASRAEGQTPGEVTIEGLLRGPEARGAFAGADDIAKNIFFVRDPAAIARAKGMDKVAPYIIDVVAPVPSGGLPQPGATQIAIPNNHLQYAMTWWSLAGILAIIFALYARSRR